MLMIVRIVHVPAARCCDSSSPADAVRFGPDHLAAAIACLTATHACVPPAPWRWNRGQWLAVLLFGVSLAGMNAFFYAAIARIPLGIAVTIEFAGPLFTGGGALPNAETSLR